MSSSRFLGGLLIGGALGAVFGLLVAPRRGDETRELIRDGLTSKVSHSMDDVRHKSSELKEKTLEAVEQLKEKSQTIAQELEIAGRNVLEKARNNRSKGDISPIASDTP